MKYSSIIKTSITWCGLLISGICSGQTNTGNIPLGTMPMQYNPSFAGETGAPRISSSASYQNYSSYYTGSVPDNNEGSLGLYAAYDQFIPAIGTGIGITTGYVNTSDVVVDANSFYYSVAVAPKFSIKGKYTFSPSLDFGHATSKIDYTDPSPFFLPEEESEVAFDVLSSKAGLLFNTNKYYVGYSVVLFNHLAQSSDNGTLDTSVFPEGFKSYLQFGYSFQRRAESKFSFTPQVAFGIMEKTYFQENNLTWEAIILNFKYSQYIAGINNTGFHLGLQNEKLRLILSGALSSQGYRSNLSFRYIFKKADKPGERNRF